MTEPNNDPSPSLLPVIAGFLLAGGLLLGLGFWVAGREPTDSTPALTLISPAADTTISGPITVRFGTNRALSLKPTGWGSGQYHVHALLRGVEHMPGARDIRPLGNNSYEWTLPAIPDTGSLQMVWSLPNHVRFSRGASVTVRIVAR